MTPSIRNRVRGYLYSASLVMIVVLLLLCSLIQVFLVRHQSRANADAIFEQIGQVLENNEKELEETKAEFKEICLRNADTVAYIVDGNPAVVDTANLDENVGQLRHIAALVGVDEIHIFDDTGRLFIGTNPEYIGYTFDSGEQMRFFKPLLSNRSLRLCQDIQNNTAEGKPMQYAAVWGDHYIVQIGTNPETVNAVTERNNSSHIFSLLSVNPGVTLYAIDLNGSVVGSTNEADVGRSSDEVGLSLSRLSSGKETFTAKLQSGTRAYCVVYRFASGYIVHAESNKTLYRNVAVYAPVLTLALVVTDLMLIFAVHQYIRRHVIDSIDRVNAALGDITDGNLERDVRIIDSREFSELSRHINEMISSILAGFEKISYVLQKADMPMAVYEYNRHMKRVRLTSGIAALFGITEERAEELSTNVADFRAFIDELRTHTLPDQNVYAVTSPAGDHYIKLEEINRGGDVFGVVVDVTETIQHRQRLEEERDIDLLTGLYNRRGAEARVHELFANEKAMIHGAVIMVDTDELKFVNDHYGHDDGDRYLRKIAEVLNMFDKEHRLAARLGGDEFMLVLHSYETQEELVAALHLLQKAQENTPVILRNGESIPLKFSMGYRLTAPGADFEELLKGADDTMYENKRQRKAKAALPKKTQS